MIGKGMKGRTGFMDTGTEVVIMTISVPRNAGTMGVQLSTRISTYCEANKMPTIKAAKWNKELVWIPRLKSWEGINSMTELGICRRTGGMGIGEVVPGAKLSGMLWRTETVLMLRLMSRGGNQTRECQNTWGENQDTGRAVMAREVTDLKNFQNTGSEPLNKDSSTLWNWQGSVIGLAKARGNGVPVSCPE